MKTKNTEKMIKISHLAIDSTESLQPDQSYDQQAKHTLFRKCLLFLVSIAGTTSMNMNVENRQGEFVWQRRYQMQHIIFYAHVHACSPSYTDEE